MRAAIARTRSVRVAATAQPGERAAGGFLGTPVPDPTGPEPPRALPAGGKVEQWLKTPFDVAAFGPRAALGALVSLPERLQML
jgi:hypothetical protein